MRRKRTLAERDTQLVSLTAILTFRVTPVMSDEPQQTLQAAAGRGSDGVTGQVRGRDASDTTGVIGDRWLQRGRLQMAAETDKLSHTHIDTDHGLLSQVKWRDIGCSLHGKLSFHRLARARCEGGDLMR